MLTVKGITIDSSANKPLGYVTVALLDAKTNQSVRAGLTKDDGSFELKAPMGKAYLLSFVSIGYKSKTINISGADAGVNVGKVLIAAASSQQPVGRSFGNSVETADEAGSRPDHIRRAGRPR